MITSSADFVLNFGCGSTGMPRPLSVTVTKPSFSTSTSIQLAWPATASSMAVVDHLGEEVMEALLVGAADIHARPAPHRLQPLQHLDVGGRIFGVGEGQAVRDLPRRDAFSGRAALATALRLPTGLSSDGEQVVGGLLFGGFHRGHGWRRGSRHESAGSLAFFSCWWRAVRRRPRHLRKHVAIVCHRRIYYEQRSNNGLAAHGNDRASTYCCHERL